MTKCKTNIKKRKREKQKINTKTLEKIELGKAPGKGTITPKIIKKRKNKLAELMNDVLRNAKILKK